MTPDEDSDAASAETALPDAVYSAHARFRYGLRRFLRFSEREAGLVGATPQQHQLLLAIRGSPGRTLSVGEVARELMLRPHSALALVDRAAEKGMVRKDPDPADGRRVQVRLTPLGEGLISRVTAAHRTALALLWADIPPLG